MSGKIQIRRRPPDNISLNNNNDNTHTILHPPACRQNGLELPSPICAPVIFLSFPFSQDPPFRVTPRRQGREITRPRLCVIPRPFSNNSLYGSPRRWLITASLNDDNTHTHPTNPRLQAEWPRVTFPPPDSRDVFSFASGGCVLSPFQRFPVVSLFIFYFCRAAHSLPSQPLPLLTCVPIYLSGP